jgi:hypothetical protein
MENTHKFVSYRDLTEFTIASRLRRRYNCRAT